MIKYVQNKTINYNVLESILAESTRLNHFTNEGPAKLLLESKLKEILKLPKRKSVVCATNGTAALHALILFYQKRGLKRFVGPSFTFPSCNVAGFKTKLVDISLENYLFDNEDVIIKDNDCIIITNLFGTYPKNLKEILDKCKRHDTKVILDNASSPLTMIEGENICSFGDAVFGSLHHTKYLGFGEGGFIVIDSEHEREINEILGFGFSKSASNRVSCIKSSNFKISDISSAATLQHVLRYDIKKHIDNQNMFLDMLAGLKGVSAFNYSAGVVYGNLPILFEHPIDKTIFRENQIEAHKYYYPLKKHKNSFFLYNRIINLPLHCDLQRSDIESMINVIKEAIK